MINKEEGNDEEEGPLLDAEMYYANKATKTTNKAEMESQKLSQGTWGI